MHAPCVPTCQSKGHVGLHFPLQSYNTPRTIWQLLAFSIRKLGENKRVNNGYSTLYKHKNIFGNFPVVWAKQTVLFNNPFPSHYRLQFYSFFQIHLLLLSVKHKKILLYIYIITYFLYYFSVALTCQLKKNCKTVICNAVSFPEKGWLFFVLFYFTRICDFYPY